MSVALGFRSFALISFIFVCQFTSDPIWATHSSAKYIASDSPTSAFDSHLPCSTEGSLKRPKSTPTSNEDLADKLAQQLISDIKKKAENVGDVGNYPVHYSPADGETFDFIVVGGGAAGSVVGARLSEVGEWRVLLLEAGGDPPKVSEVPALTPHLQDTEIDWQYKTDPDENNCLGRENKSCKWSRGKVLGGSSTMSFMLHVRGTREDYDSWAADGLRGWSYDDVLPYFKKSEDMRSFQVLARNDSSRFHRTKGNLKIDIFDDPEPDPVFDMTFSLSMR